jgi:2-haloacid dehalogenase
MPTGREGRRYELVLLDADDTLFDFGACEAAALWAALGDAGIPWSDRAPEEYARANREAWAAFEKGLLSHEELKLRRFEDFLGRMGIEADARIVGGLYVERLSEQRVLMPGAEETLRRLAVSYKLVLVTNGIKEVQRRRLKGSPIALYLSATIISEEIGFAKPDPRMLDAAARAAGVSDKSSMIIVGDSLSSDIRAGLDYGIDTVWLNRRCESSGATRPTYEIRALPQLLEIL